MFFSVRTAYGCYGQHVCPFRLKSPHHFNIVNSLAYRQSTLISLLTLSGIDLLWDGVSFLELSVSSKYRGRLHGLCGNFNGDKRDDFFGLDGSVYPDGQSFGDSNRVGGLRACSVLPR